MGYHDTYKQNKSFAISIGTKFSFWITIKRENKFHDKINVQLNVMIESKMPNDEIKAYAGRSLVTSCCLLG